MSARVLVACEYSGRIREALRRRGVDAVSCDLLPTEQPGPHIQGDVLDVLGRSWDGLIAHSPCTYLTVSGLHWNGRVPGRAEKTEQGIAFAGAFINARHIPKRGTENPVGILSSRVRKPDQIIQPYDFGEDASKKTCLWLTGLPALKPTVRVEPAASCCGARFTEPACPVCQRERESPQGVGQSDGERAEQTASVCGPLETSVADLSGNRGRHRGAMGAGLPRGRGTRSSCVTPSASSSRANGPVCGGCMKTIEQVACESTCLKRVTVCVIMDADETVLACESNRCSPPAGRCTRLGVINTQADYPSASGCNWEHAEQRAVRALPPGSQPLTVIVYGHDFICEDCATAIRAAGITEIWVVSTPCPDGVGLRGAA